MAEETATVSATPVAATPKKAKKSPSKKPKALPSHPKVSAMVVEAISSLKERGGSSLQAIKKHIASHHKVDIDRLTPFIKKYLKSAVAGGNLVQTKGKGATGSFKVSASGQKGKESGKGKKKPKKAAASSAKKAKPAAKKPAKAKEEKKKPATKKVSVKKASKAKSPKKAVKAAKPKPPKAKKLKAAKKATPKKSKKLY
ncbi:LOW QUALITY PROTEIN: histone H1E-like [Stegodyphus dumicola]|uniref:LOW QUALITY PROTEIN: histone H1E-like n=1 Tax=Stegodyphus dumicola TaxID=202533 RepID=UPI0015AAAE96|nr:LOW QUALITY PROTEIN: histone H1E-like [Stegodyphus dumicola]